MQFYLILSHYNSSLLLIFAPPRPLDPEHDRIMERVMRRGGGHTTIIMIMVAMGEVVVFPFTLPAPREKRLRHCQTPSIIVVLVMFEVVAMAIVGLSTLASLTEISLDLALALYLVPPPIEIDPPLPAPYSFYIDLDLDPVPVPIPGLDRHQISDHQLFPI